MPISRLTKNQTGTGVTAAVDLGAAPYEVLLELDDVGGECTAEIYGQRDADENWVLLGTLSIADTDDPAVAVGEITFSYARMRLDITALSVGAVATASVAHRKE